MPPQLAMVTFLSVLVIGSTAKAQNRDRTYPPDFPDAKSLIYKTVGDTQLKLFLFTPEGTAPEGGRPAIVFFFGGGWQSGSPAQFAEQARYLAKRGMVAICADYRVASRHKVTPVDCVEDAKAAMAFVRSHAAEMGIDENRIAAGGGSAGGHLAACTGVVEGFEPPDVATSSRPNALILFNPAVKLAAFKDEVLGASVIERINERTGGRAKEISPIHHVGQDEPATLIFHGDEDPTVPFDSVMQFCDEMCGKGNHCQLIGFKGQKHGFFNVRGSDDKMFLATTYLMDRFLVSLGWIEGEPSIAMPVEESQLTRLGCNGNAR